MIKAVIVEDEKRAATLLKNYISNKYNGVISIKKIATSVSDGIDAINYYKPDLVFLDIFINEGTSFDILDTIDSTDLDIIFTTGHEGYVNKAFEYFAFNYLNKPLDENKLYRVVDNYLLKKTKFDFERFQVLSKQIERPYETISIPTNKNYVIINIIDLIYCEASGNYTYFHTRGNGKHIASGTIKKFEEILPEAHFYRINRSILLNLKNIKTYNKLGVVITTNNEKLKVSSRKLNSFLKILKFSNYIIN